MGYGVRRGELHRRAVVHTLGVLFLTVDILHCPLGHVMNITTIPLHYVGFEFSHKYLWSSYLGLEFGMHGWIDFAFAMNGLQIMDGRQIMSGVHSLS